ncbi:MAG: hypothetical protein U1E76_06870 [Planctomycetota bacterium]
MNVTGVPCGTLEPFAGELIDTIGGVLPPPLPPSAAAALTTPPVTVMPLSAAIGRGAEHLVAHLLVRPAGVLRVHQRDDAGDWGEAIDVPLA